MCLAYPARIVEINSNQSPVMCTVDCGGVRAPVCLAWLPEVAVGDYVIVHVGFAISKLDEVDALKTLRLLSEATVDVRGTDAIH